MTRSKATAALLAVALALPAWALAASAGTVAASLCASRSGTAPCVRQAQLSQPDGVAVAPDGTVLVTSRGSGAISSFRADLTPLPSTAAISGAAGIALSPDGSDVYVAAAGTGVVASYARQPDGNLTAIGTTDAPSPLAGAESVVVSPDGRQVYVAASIGDVIGIFARDGATGALSQAGCVGVNKPACAPGRGLDGVTALALSPDGGALYAASGAASAIVAFTRDPLTGALTQLPGAFGCASSLTIADCAVQPALRSPTAIVAGTTTVYAASTGNDALVAFARDPSGGLAAARCVSSTPAAAAGCTPSGLLDGVSALALTPDGTVLYASSTRDDAVVSLPASTLVTAACVHQGRRNGCRTATTLDDPGAIAVAGASVIATATASESVTVLAPQVPPACIAQAAAVRANASTSVSLVCSDANGDPLTRSIPAPPQHGTISAIRGNVATYRPAPGYVGADTFTFAASDGADASVPVAATVTVTPPATGPAVTLLARVAPLAAGGRITLVLACPPTAVGRCTVAIGGTGLRRTATIAIARGRLGRAILQLRARPLRALILTITARDGSGRARTQRVSVSVRRSTL